MPPASEYHDGPIPTETGVPPESRSRALLWWPLLAQVCAALAVLLVVVVVLLYVQNSPSGDFDALGALVYGVMIAGVVGTVVWTVGMSRVARKLFVPGERLAVVLMSGSATLLLAGVGSLIGGQFDVDLVGEVGVYIIAALLAIATLSAPSVMFRRWDARLALGRGRG